MTARSFEQLFDRAPEATSSAPGRVNLLGEHTDYNQGLVLPVAIPRTTTVRMARSDDGHHHFHSAQLGDQVSFPEHEESPPGFARYLQGCVEVLRSRGYAIPPLLVSVDSSVPIGAGLSSSAALEVAALRALRSLLALELDDVEVAQLAHEAENRFAGVRCGILDQMASSLASSDSMLFLDTRTIERRLLPLPAGANLLIMDSGVSRSLASSGYNQRRAECERAARILGLASLRDLEELAPALGLPEPLDRRVRHVFTENERVCHALHTPDAAAFGRLMNQSHASLSADYEVSVPALDELAATLQADPQVFGAKLTGAGFGGACVALVRAGTSRNVAARAMSRFQSTHLQATVLLAD